MALEYILTFFAIIILIGASAFFSGSETALTASSRARMHTLQKEGNKRASMVNALTDAPERFISAILLGNNMVNILASALATTLAIKLFGEVGVAYATITMTIVVVIFAEVLPKIYAFSNPDSTALRVISVLRWVVAILGPVGGIMQRVARLVLRAFAPNAANASDMLSAHDELRGAIDLHHREGGVVKHDRDMLGGVLDLKDLEVSDIMVHRTKIQTISLDEPNDHIVDAVLRSPYTRLPLWRDEPENIVGVLHAKDLLRELRRIGWDLAKLDVTAIAAPTWFIPDTTPLKDQLNAFLRRKSHFALVVDEYGEVMGLVTLEDIIEEIVGEIADEHDIVVSGVRTQTDGSVIVDGAVPIRDLNRAMDWSLPDDEATTAAGLVMHEAQIIPDQGQAFTFYGFRFEVLKRQRNKIASLRITPIAKVDARPSV